MEALEETASTRKPDLDDVKQQILDFCRTSKTKETIFTHIGVEHVPYSYKKYIKPLIDLRLLQYTIPHNPRDNGQQYISSIKALQYLKALL